MYHLFSDTLMDNIVGLIGNSSEVSTIRMYCFKTGLLRDMNEKNYDDYFDLDDIQILYDSRRVYRENGESKWEKDTK